MGAQPAQGGEKGAALFSQIWRGNFGGVKRGAGRFTPRTVWGNCSERGRRGTGGGGGVFGPGKNPGGAQKTGTGAQKNGGKGTADGGPGKGGEEMFSPGVGAPGKKILTGG